MTIDQGLSFGLLAFVLVLFVWGRYRYDLVAVIGLMVGVLIGVVPADDAFSGLSNSAVITVAAVLIISRGLEVSGAVDYIASFMLPKSKSMTLQLTGLAGVGSGLSAIMNNVGALALLMPATINAARSLKKSPSLFLMPLSFASILGGLVTLIGTPPNIIIASYREEAFGSPFAMFDFTPVGAVVAVVGVIFLVVAGWRFLPAERLSKSATDELLDIKDYLAEVIVSKGSKAIEMTMAEMYDIAENHNVGIVGHIRGTKRQLKVGPRLELAKGDILLVEAAAEDLDKFAHKIKLEIRGNQGTDYTKSLKSDATNLVEAVITPDSRLVGRVIGDMRLRSRYNANLIGLSRSGAAVRQRLHKVSARAGDVLLLQLDSDTTTDTLNRLGLLPVADRPLNIGQRNKALIAGGLMIGAVAIAALGWIKLTIALVMAATGMVLFRIIPLRDIYESVDWPVIVLVGAMIPVGSALESTGATTLVADQIAGLATLTPSWVILTLILVVTMTLSDVMNNATTAVVMAPVSVGVANTLGLNPDAFLMAVAVGASCAFLTPIGHKNNALILGPGGYQFGDYWRMGLPLEMVVTATAVPMLLLVWPL